MPARTALLTAALTVALPGMALALPFGAPAIPSAGEAVLAHHKPGHRGGPPWTRGRGYDDDGYRDRARDRRAEAWDERPRRLACTTRYRSAYDHYLGETVRRPVRVCDERY